MYAQGNSLQNPNVHRRGLAEYNKVQAPIEYYVAMKKRIISLYTAMKWSLGCKVKWGKKKKKVEKSIYMECYHLSKNLEGGRGRYEYIPVSLYLKTKTINNKINKIVI